MIFDRFLGRFSRDLGIDLGTSSTLVYVKGKGIMINEPSVVAVNTRTEQILAVGSEARKMVGKTPSHIIAAKPLVDGVISDFEVTEKMLRYFVDKVHREGFTLIPRPRVVIGIPLGVTEVERKAVEDATLHAGAREVYLIEQPMAAAIGARLPIQDAAGNLVVDIGGGTTDIAVISLGGVVTWRSLRTAGNAFDASIMQYAREHFNLLIGERTAEETKLSIGSATEEFDTLDTKVRGRDLISGLPKEVTMTGQHVREALSRTLSILIENLGSVVESTPPELVADIHQRGILLTGGGALLRGLPELIQRETKIVVHVADDPLTAVVRGTGIVLEDLENLRHMLVLSTDSSSPGTKR